MKNYYHLSPLPTSKHIRTKDKQPLDIAVVYNFNNSSDSFIEALFTSEYDAKQYIEKQPCQKFYTIMRVEDGE